jgi:hypothetical protein
MRKSSATGPRRTLRTYGWTHPSATDAVGLDTRSTVTFVSRGELDGHFRQADKVESLESQRLGFSSKSWKSKLKSTAGEIGRIFT